MQDKVELKVLNPRSEVKNPPDTSGSHQLGGLAGKKIGVLWNGKGMGEILLPFVEKALKSRIGDVEFRTWLVPFADSTEAKEPRLREIVGYSDGVIALMGD